MDRLDSLMLIIGQLVLTGDIAMAREFAGDYAVERDSRMTGDEVVAATRARVEVARAA